MANNARKVALGVLLDVFQNEAYANLALDTALRASRLSEVDRKLVTALVYGTIAHKLTLEWYLAPFVKRAKPWVRTLLALTAFQMVYLDKIPSAAAVDEAVKLAKAVKGRQVAGFVNAVLRNFSRQPRRALPSELTERLSVQYSLPSNLTAKFLAQSGEDRTIKLLKSLATPAHASIRVNRQLTSRDEMLTALSSFSDLRPSQLSEDGLVASQGNFAATAAFKDGRITIQDETSQLVAPLMALQGDEQILDACAAPGGKTTHMAAALTTGHITACDLYDHKLHLIADNARRLGVADKITTLKLDATQAAEYFGAVKFDGERLSRLRQGLTADDTGLSRLRQGSTADATGLSQPRQGLMVDEIGSSRPRRSLVADDTDLSQPHQGLAADEIDLSQPRQGSMVDEIGSSRPRWSLMADDTDLSQPQQGLTGDTAGSSQSRQGLTAYGTRSSQPRQGSMADNSGLSQSRRGLADRSLATGAPRRALDAAAPKLFDRILVDAPCSGLGLMRRKPDIRYRKATTDFLNLQKIQLAILDSCAPLLKVGGILIYSTCTLADEENFDVIQLFLKNHPEYAQTPIQHAKSDILTKKCLYITPEMYGTDGFFIAKLRKIS